MKINEAVKLIEHETFQSLQPQIWTDLGCGNGTFTLALAKLLKPQSLIYAIDTDRKSLSEIPEIYQAVRIEKINLDFTKENLDLPQIDGVLMANSLHFVQNEREFLQRMAEKSKRFLIVEYESEIPNTWVPFPIKFQSLSKLFAELNFVSAQKISTRKSVYGGEIYSAIFER